MPRAIQLLVIHCTASANGDSLFRTEGGQTITPVQIIDRWHRERGFARKPDARARLNPDLSSIGYHWVIYTDGARATGRSAFEIGAHVSGHNQSSIGIALVGTDQFTPAQWDALAAVVKALCGQYRIPLSAADPRDPRGLRGVIGHGEILGVNKACPGFSVAQWLRSGLVPEAKHVRSA